MTALAFYKFVKNNRIEWHWGVNGKNQDDVFMFVDFDYLKEFCDLLGYNILSESGISCTLKEGYVAFEMKDILDNFDILLGDIFEEDDEI